MVFCEMNELEELIMMSKYAGMREDLIQAGGGNTSVKMNDGTMLIKSSGYQLSEITNDKGFSIVDYKQILNLFKGKSFLCEEDGKNILNNALIQGKRPSIETFLHSITDKYTLHTHPVLVNIVACRKNWKEILKNLFPKAVLVDYATPGVKLANEYYKAASAMPPKATLYFLQNHGMVVSGSSAKAVIDKTEEIIDVLSEYLNIDNRTYKYCTELFNKIGNGIYWRVTDINILSNYKSIIDDWNHNVCPDCTVFLGKRILRFKNEIDIDVYNKFVEEFGEVVIIEYKDGLYIKSETVKKAQEIQSVLSFAVQVLVNNRKENINYLKEEEQNCLLNWDAEKYRKKL